MRGDLSYAALLLWVESVELHGRLPWKNPNARQRLPAHRENPEHPYSSSFGENKILLCEILESPLGETGPAAELRHRRLSLLAREIPPFFCSTSAKPQKTPPAVWSHKHGSAG